jgi:hypothetical protein
MVVEQCATTTWDTKNADMDLSATSPSFAHPRDGVVLLLSQGKRPDIVQHIDGSESDIRGYVQTRKISGGTRCDLSKRCRDGFASLKKTCLKLGISFWDYLGDRIKQLGQIPPSPHLIYERAAAASAAS